jgi:hypothetical protein
MGDASNNEIIVRAISSRYTVILSSIVSQEIPSSPDPGSPNSLFSDTPVSEIVIPKKPKPTANAKDSKPPNKPGRRSTNPQGSIASMAPSEIPVASGISTKQRLAQGALAPTLPKEIVPPKPPKPPPKPIVTNRSTLSGLSFKKRSFDVSGMSESSTHPSLSRNIPNEPTLSSLNSPLAQSPTSAFFSPSASFSSPVLQQRTSFPESTVFVFLSVNFEVV